MEQTFSITSIIFLGTLAWQDFRSRMITAWLLPVAGIFLSIAEAFHAGVTAIGQNAGINLLLLLLQFVTLSLWISLRNRKWINIVDTHIGLGDILFLACIAPALSPVNFCVLLTGGTMLTLLIHTAMRLLKKTSDPKIPLAGYLGSIILLFCLLNIIGVIPVHLSDSDWLSDYIPQYNYP